MSGVIWLSNVENSEPIGIPMSRISLIEQKPAAEGNIVAVHLDTGKEIRVIESLAVVKAQMAEQNGCACFDRPWDHPYLGQLSAKRPPN